MKKQKKLITILLSMIILLGLVSCGLNNKNIQNNSSISQSELNTDSHYPVTLTTYNYAK